MWEVPSQAGGVPQGSVLGPLLLLLLEYKSPGPESHPSMLVGDDNLTREMSIGDRSLLERDLERLERWSHVWVMTFMSTSCSVMRRTGHDKTRPVQDSSPVATFRNLRVGETFRLTQ